MELVSLRLPHTLDTRRYAETRQTRTKMAQDSLGRDTTISSTVLCWSTIKKTTKKPDIME